jgi:hypothetical protein
MLETTGWCDGVFLRAGDTVGLTGPAALDYIRLGLAEPVTVPPETAEATPAPERAARTRKPKPRG